MSHDLTGLPPIAPVLATSPVRSAQAAFRTSNIQPSTPAVAAPQPAEQLHLPREQAMQVDTINQRLAQLAARADKRGQEIDLKV